MSGNIFYNMDIYISNDGYYPYVIGDKFSEKFHKVTNKNICLFLKALSDPVDTGLTTSNCQKEISKYIPEYNYFPRIFRGSYSDIPTSWEAHFLYDKIFTSTLYMNKNISTKDGYYLGLVLKNGKVLLLDNTGGISKAIVLDSINSAIPGINSSVVQCFLYNNYYYNKAYYYKEDKFDINTVSVKVISFDQYALRAGYYDTYNGLASLKTWIGTTEPVDADNPYSGGGNSSTGGGGGTYDDSSDTVAVPNLPTLSAIQTGFVSMYNPTISQVQALASYMWTDDIVTNLTKLFGDPIKAIISLALCPVTPTTSGAVNIKLGNLDSGVSANAVSNQYVQFDCGSVTLSEYYAAAVDYAPYTTVQLYVPYCGIYTVDIDDVMAGTNHLVYNIDILTGACSAMLTCNKNTLNSVVYNFTGNVNTNIPVSSADWSQFYRAVLAAAGAVGAAIVTGGASAAGTAAVGAAEASSVASSSVASASMGAASNVLGSAKPIISRGGGISTSMGALSVQTPYFIISRPVQSIPATYQHYAGLPANITAALSSISGLTVCESIFIDLPTATSDEKNEIEALLKGGIIL